MCTQVVLNRYDADREVVAGLLRVTGFEDYSHQSVFQCGDGVVDVWANSFIAHIEKYVLQGVATGFEHLRHAPILGSLSIPFVFLLLAL